MEMPYGPITEQMAQGSPKSSSVPTSVLQLSVQWPDCNKRCPEEEDLDSAVRINSTSPLATTHTFVTKQLDVKWQLPAEHAMSYPQHDTAENTDKHMLGSIHKLNFK